MVTSSIYVNILYPLAENVSSQKDSVNEKS